MKLEFKDVINRNKGKPSLVLCHGPSLNDLTANLDEIKKSTILIGINRWYNFHSTVPDYWVLANNFTTIQNQSSKINLYKQTTVVYADSVDLTDRNWISANIHSDYLPYDQRHFANKPCGSCLGRCKSIIVPGRLTIQEELKKHTGTDRKYGCGDTVAIHGIALGIFLGCCPIYVIGLHADYRVGYAKNKGNRQLSNHEKTIFDGVQKRIVNDLKMLSESASRMGTEIINLYRDSNIHVLKKGDIPWS